MRTLYSAENRDDCMILRQVLTPAEAGFASHLAMRSPVSRPGLAYLARVAGLSQGWRVTATTLGLGFLQPGRDRRRFRFAAAWAKQKVAWRHHQPEFAVTAVVNDVDGRHTGDVMGPEFVGVGIGRPIHFPTQHLIELETSRKHSHWRAVLVENRVGELNVVVITMYDPSDGNPIGQGYLLGPAVDCPMDVGESFGVIQAWNWPALLTVPVCVRGRDNGEAALGRARNAERDTEQHGRSENELPVHRFLLI